MSFFQLRTLPGYAWPPLAAGPIAQVWVAYLELDRLQWLEPDRLETQQLEQARTLLSHSIAHVPYYREALSQAGIVPGAIRTMNDFRRIPILRRRTYQEHNARFEAKTLPAATVASNTRKTSGSSGTPTTVFQTNLVHMWWHAFFLRDLEWAGIDPSGSLAAIRSTGKKDATLLKLLNGVSASTWLQALHPLIEMGPSHVMDIQQDHRVQLRWLQGVAPDYLLSYPSNLEVLAELARGLRPLTGPARPLPSLKAVHAISDTLTEDAQKNIEDAFGVPVKNTYSCAEAGYLASPCPAGHGLHVHAENVILEVLDDAGQPCQPGQTGQVFITHLHNFRGPIIRYELGDEATLGMKGCPCGRGLPLLARVQGKNSPMFQLPDGRLKSSTPVARLVRKAGGHWQHQVIQKARDHVVVRVAIDPSWTDEHTETIKTRLRDFFEAPIRVDVEIHDRIPMPESGKFQSIINELTAPAGKGA